MDLNNEIEFCVDQQYENEKGVFTVISIQEDEMVIRWTNGEEIRTEIDLQQRIQARRQREKNDMERLANVVTPGSHKPSPPSKGQEFQGLQASDFKSSAAQTTWRGRNKLGGAVTRSLPKTKFRFNSWAVGQKPEIHWQDMARHSREDADRQARFFVRLDHLSLIFGFSVARPDDADRSSKYWNAFADWVTRQESEDMIHALAADNTLTVNNRAQIAFGELAPGEDGWRVMGPNVTKTVDSLTAYLESAPAAGGVDLEISRKIDRQEAVARGADIAEDIAKIFALLMPLYQATIV